MGLLRNSSLNHLFVDFKKAYDAVIRDVIKLFNKNTQSNAPYFLMIFVYDMFRKLYFHHQVNHF
jgi:hypothetical protein